MTRLVSILFGLFGATAIAIGLGLFVTGPDTTAKFFSAAMETLFGTKGYDSGLESANTDSELRFFSVFWIGYGALLIRFSFDASAYRNALLVLMAVFFLGGVGRYLAHMQTGAPDLLFVALGWIELVLPLILSAMLLIFAKPAK